MPAMPHSQFTFSKRLFFTWHYFLEANKSDKGTAEEKKDTAKPGEVYYKPVENHPEPKVYYKPVTTAEPPEVYYKPVDA